MTDPLSGEPTITDSGEIIVGHYEPEEAPMNTNPIPETVRGTLYVIGISIGILAVIAGPLMIALDTPEVWQAVIVSTVGAVTTLLATLSRANLGGEEG